MNIEQQVCSLELAQQLKKLGVEQESLWYWTKRRDCSNGIPKRVEDIEYKYILELWGHITGEHVSAFTVAELGEMLPLEVCDSPLKIWREMGKESWDVGYNTSSNIGKEVLWFQSETEADARARCLI